MSRSRGRVLWSGGVAAFQWVTVLKGLIVEAAGRYNVIKQKLLTKISILSGLRFILYQLVLTFTI